MKIFVNFLRDSWLARSTAIIINVLATGEGHATWSESAPKPYTLHFDDVTCIYHHEIWHVYKVNC